MLGRYAVLSKPPYLSRHNVSATLVLNPETLFSPGERLRLHEGVQHHRHPGADVRVDYEASRGRRVLLPKRAAVRVRHDERGEDLHRPRGGWQPRAHPPGAHVSGCVLAEVVAIRLIVSLRIACCRCWFWFGRC